MTSARSDLAQVEALASHLTPQAVDELAAIAISSPDDWARLAAIDIILDLADDTPKSRRGKAMRGAAQ